MDNLPAERPRRSKLPWILLFGALLGCLLATWLAPKVIAWYFNPPAEMGFNCVVPIQWALKRFQIAQLVGAGLGALIALLLYFAIGKRRREAV